MGMAGRVVKAWARIRNASIHILSIPLQSIRFCIGIQSAATVFIPSEIAILEPTLPLPTGGPSLNTNHPLPHNIGIYLHPFCLEFCYVDDVGIDFFFCGFF